MTTLTDLELYNCPKLTRLPDVYYNLPNIQAFNLARNKGIKAAQLRDDWEQMATSKIGKTLQILYLSYNNLEEFPATLGTPQHGEAGLARPCQQQYQEGTSIHQGGYAFITLSQQ